MSQYEFPVPGILVKENAATDAECNNLLAFYKKNKKLQQPAQSFFTNDGKAKKGTELWISPESKEKDQEFVIGQINNALFGGAAEYVKQYPILEVAQHWRMEPVVGFQHYKPGEGYNMLHYDNMNQYTMPRMMTWFLCLTDSPGAGMVFPYLNYTAECKKGTLYIFANGLTHSYKDVLNKQQSKTVIHGFYAMMPMEGTTGHMAQEMSQQSLNIVK